MTKNINNDSRHPWGFFDVLSDEKDHKVKRITVNPNKRLSYQIHKRRSEHWFIVKGSGIVTIDKHDIEVSVGNSVDIKTGTAHRIKNSGGDDLVFIEVQTGDYFGEDDIERIEDDFGRVPLNPPKGDF
jgi:mannose-6-phosphate isomerase